VSTPFEVEKKLDAEIARLKTRLQETEETLDAIRRGEIDALVMSRASGPQVFTLAAADLPYRLLIEQMQEGAVTLSTTGLILFCNPCFATFVGAERETLLGSPLAQFVAATDQPILDDMLRRALTKPARGELRLRAGAGDERTVAMSLANLASEDGPILCGILSDLTQHYRRSRELAEANRKLREQIANRERAEAELRQAQKMEAVGQLTGGLAHDFNNLLTIVLGNLQLARKAVHEPRLVAKVNNAIGAAERGARLTEQLLSFARRQTLRLDAIDVNALLPDLQNLFQHAVGNQIDLVIRRTPDLWPSKTDRNQLESALLNLIINARDAMPDGGRITIAAGNAEIDDEAAARIGEMLAGQYVVITVSDTGTGIDPDVLPRVVEPFFTTKGVGLGSGLGLSQVYGFVRQTGGTFKIESTVGRGTAVHLYLPATEALPSEPTATVAREDDAAPGKILVVEDNTAVRELAIEVLEGLGYEVLAAPNATSALKTLLASPDVDLVFSDVVMPGTMNGIELAHEVVRRHPDCAILLTSGFTATPGTGPSGAEEFQFLPKPYEPAALAGAVAAALGRHPMPPPQSITPNRSLRGRR